MGWVFETTPQALVTESNALPGRPAPVFTVPTHHRVLGTLLQGDQAVGSDVIYLAMGCFWGAEKALWQFPGVVTTAVGYMGGFTPNPTYDEVCTGRTGHTETVMVVFDPTVLRPVDLLRKFWEMHDPTQGFRQGADVGAQYRSAIFTTTDTQLQAAHTTGTAYRPVLTAAGYGPITTEIRPVSEAGPFYYAEADHQQYLDRVPHGYCPVHSTGVACPAE